MSHLNYMWLSEHINEYNSVNLYKYVWIHPILHCFLLSGWMLLIIVTAAFPLHNPIWGVWLVASGPIPVDPAEESLSERYRSLRTPAVGQLRRRSGPAAVLTAPHNFYKTRERICAGVTRVFPAQPATVTWVYCTPNSCNQKNNTEWPWIQIYLTVMTK